MYDTSKATITLPLVEFEKMKEEYSAMYRALNEKSIMVARYSGYKYHLVNIDTTTQMLVDRIKELEAKK